jgi:hypothetical protein
MQRQPVEKFACCFTDATKILKTRRFPCQTAAPSSGFTATRAVSGCPERRTTSPRQGGRDWPPESLGKNSRYVRV